jgi:hypothetical protein
MTESKKQEIKTEQKETVVLKNDIFVDGVFYAAGTQIEVTAEIKELLSPFGYFNS